MNTPAPRTVTGIGVCPGLVAGPIVHMPLPIEEPAPGLRLSPRDDLGRHAERIREASLIVAATLDAAANLATGDTKDVLEATATIAADPTLVADAQRRVREDHLVPERAVWEAAAEVTAQFEALGGYFAERVSDLVDIRDRLIAVLTGRPQPGLPANDSPYILVAIDLAPSVTAALDPAQVLAIVTDGAGPTSHTAIVANAKGIPAVVAAEGAHALLLAGHPALVNGSTGEVILDPTPDQCAPLNTASARVRTFQGPGQTRDGHRVQLLANIGDPSEARPAAAAGAEGVGLFRSEFCFLGREQPPTVDEQVEAYRRVLSEFPGRKVVVRTLDSGADKPLLFLTDDTEENPALGVRGLRTAKRHPELLDTQLEAIAAAARAETADVWVMAPMVSTVPETEDFVASCARHGLTTAGVMVEVPSAALLAGPIFSHAAFASIGTNDLTQYAMAADRLLGSLAELSDPWQPAVLQLIAMTCAGGAAKNRPVGVCGEAASNPVLAVVLVGLGVSSLSMTPRALADVAAVLSKVDLDLCHEVARLALDSETAAEARTRVRARLDLLTELGL